MVLVVFSVYAGESESIRCGAVHFSCFAPPARARVDSSCLYSACLFRAESCFLRIGGRARISSLIESICFSPLAISFSTLRRPAFSRLAATACRRQRSAKHPRASCSPDCLLESAYPAGGASKKESCCVLVNERKRVFILARQASGLRRSAARRARARRTRERLWLSRNTVEVRELTCRAARSARAS